MIARYLSKKNANIYAGKLARIYGPDVRFDVVCLPDPFFDDPVWYVLGSGTVAGKSFAEYAAPPREYHLEAEDEQGSEICPIWSQSGILGYSCGLHPQMQGKIVVIP